jgi:hypothetical protein
MLVVSRKPDGKYQTTTKESKNMKRSSVIHFATLLILALANGVARAQLPPNFPGFTVTTYDSNAVAPGSIFLSVTDPGTNGAFYMMVLTNDATPLWFQAATNEVYDFKPVSDGYLHYGELFHTYSYTGGGDVIHQLLDENQNPAGTVAAGNGYVADCHDFQLLPNGHVLLIGYYRTRMDLSQLVPGAYPNALVAGAVIQELDAQQNVVFQWRTWDHFTINSYYGPYGYASNPIALNPVIDGFHLNSVFMDTDGNLLVSNFGMDVWKINRQTGQIMWRLGGLANQFSFVGVNPQQALTEFSDHDVTRLANGDILVFCNANQQATYSSAVYEYQLDETNKIATLVWSYKPATNVYSWHYGSAQRLPNGNTFIGWGSAQIVPGVGGTLNQYIPACTEVTPAGKVVFEMRFNDPTEDSYRAFRFPFPPQSQATADAAFEVGQYNTYTFAGLVGVSLTVNSGGGGYNSMTVTSEPYGPVNPLFNGTAPCVLPLRVSFSENAIPTLNGDFAFSTANLGYANPANLTIYYRPQTGSGVFEPQPTSYNPVLGQLTTTLSLTGQGGDFGEVIFGYPDVAQVPYPPILNTVETYPGIQPDEVIAPAMAATNETDTVNQQQPIWLSWSPAGIAGSYYLQIATNQDFANPVVDIPSQTDAFFVWSNAAPGTTYFYRVNTSNGGGVSDWATNSFVTVAPMIQMTSPNGGEVWLRGTSHFVQWNGNVPENVAIALYKGGALVEAITTNTPDTDAYKWSVGFNLEPGSDYSVQVSSTTNAALFANSAGNFSIIDAPTLNPGAVTPLPNGTIQIGLTVPGAAQATLLGSTNLTIWQVLQSVPLVNGSAVVTDDTATNIPARFYRLQVP